MHLVNRLLWTVSALLLLALLAAVWGLIPEPGADAGLGTAGVAAEDTSGAESARSRIDTRKFEEPRPRSTAHDGLTLRVLNDAREAVPEAEVRFMIQGAEVEALLREMMLRSGWDRIPLLEGHGELLRTDAAGEVRLPRFASLASVIASHEGLWSMLDLREGMDGPVLMVLRPSQSLSIEVVKADGRPAAGIPLALRSQSEGRHLDLWRGNTDANGLATVRHVGTVVQQDRLGGKLFLTPAFPCAPECGRPVDLRSVQDAPLRLTLPELAHLTVAVETPDGTPLPRGTWVTLRGTDRAPGEVATPVVDGFARFPAVATGVPWELEAHTSELWQPVRVSHAGAVAAGIEVTTAVRFERAWPALCGTLCADGGGTLPQQRFSVYLLNERNTPQASFIVTTDAAGRFRCDLRPEHMCRPARLEVTQIQPDTGRILTAALLPISVLPSEGVLDVGSVWLQRAPRLVSGLVVDDAGRPLGDTTVEVEQRDAQGVWTPSHELRATADAEGRFDVFGPAPAAPLRLVVQRERWRLREAVPFVPGHTGVRLVLERLSSVAGQILTDASVDPRQLEIAFEPVRGGVPVASARPGADGQFLIEFVPQGTWRCVVTGAGGHSEIHTIPDVRVGVQSEDARLACIDLRGRCRIIIVTVLNSVGAAVDEAWVHAAAGARGAWRRAGDGHLELAIGSQPLTLTVESQGLRSERREQITSDALFQLAPGVRVHLALNTELPSGTRLHALAVPEMDSNWPRRATAGGVSAPVFDAEGRMTLALPRPGRWRLRFTLSRPGTDAAVGLRSSAEDTFEVLDVLEQNHRITLNATALAEAERALQQKP